MHNDGPVGPQQTNDFIDQRQKQFDLGRREVMDREPTRLGRPAEQPCCVRGVTIFQLVALGEAHNDVGRSLGQHRRMIGPNLVLSAQPKVTGNTGRERNLVDASVHVHCKAHVAVVSTAPVCNTGGSPGTRKFRNFSWLKGKALTAN